MKKVLIISFALFSMFFGAGNVFLPPYIGLNSGNEMLVASLGTILTGVGLPLLGLLIVFKNKGEYSDLFKPMGDLFTKSFLFLALLSIGPIIAIPRTASTTYEMGIHALFPSSNRLIVTIIFFLICILFSLHENTVIDEIGKYLTPSLLISLLVLIIAGIFNSDTITRETVVDHSFFFGFMEGYNTLDAIASIIFANFVYKSIQNEKEPMKLSVNAAIIAAIGLAIVYIGMINIGATINIKNAYELSRTEYVLAISKILLGKYGIIVLAIIVSFACLTTAIGLITSVSEYFVKYSKNKISYNFMVILVAFVSFILSQLEVDIIIKMAIPILMVFYPVLIVILMIALFKNKYITDRLIAITTYTTLISSLIDRFYPLPLSNIGFAWLIPSLMAFLIGILLERGKKNGFES